MAMAKELNPNLRELHTLIMMDCIFVTHFTTFRDFSFFYTLKMNYFLYNILTMLMDPEVKHSDVSLHIPHFQTHLTLPPVLFYEAPNSQIIVIDNVFTPNECNELIYECENCPVQCTPTSTTLRNKKCIQFKQLTDALNDRIRRFIPDVLDWTYDTINEHWRYVHCNPTSTFAPHFDGVFVKSVDLKSIYTVMVYLTESTDHSGQLLFPLLCRPPLSIEPIRGRVVLFNQDLLHEGLANTHNKAFIRSECMYKRSVPIETELDRQAMVLFNMANPESEMDAFALSPLLRDMVLNC